jgi:hypothetical protein
MKRDTSNTTTVCVGGPWDGRIVEFVPREGGAKVGDVMKIRSLGGADTPYRLEEFYATDVAGVPCSAWLIYLAPGVHAAHAIGMAQTLIEQHRIKPHLLAGEVGDEEG